MGTSCLRDVSDRGVRVAPQELGQIDLLQEEPTQTIRRRGWRSVVLLAPAILASGLLPPSRDEARLLSRFSCWQDKLSDEMRTDQRHMRPLKL
jgi:hypothetical protein